MHIRCFNTDKKSLLFNSGESKYDEVGFILDEIGEIETR